MNPELDDLLVLTISTAFANIVTDWLKITALREGVGGTINEGLCYEYCAGMPFKGKLTGELFLGMDGFTRLLLLPYIVNHIEMESQKKELVESAMDTMVQKMAKEFFSELEEVLDIERLESRDVSHKIVPLPQDEYRKYTIIYFLRDDVEKKYLGRIYLNLALEKK